MYFRTVSPDTLSVNVSRLEKFTGYEIQIAALTSKGVGGKSNKTIIYTDEDGALVTYSPRTFFVMYEVFYILKFNVHLKVVGFF